jgi:GNAT superfamily N-acetyltransferase
MQFRNARPDEAGLVSDLAVRSKAYWGYDDEFLAGSRIQLAVYPDEMTSRRVTVAEVDGSVVGFYAIEGVPPVGELSLMFVDPEHIRAGVGRRLFAHAVATAREVGLGSFTIDADPFAEDFYLAMGAIRTGLTPSSIRAGRFLPQLTFTVTGD